MDSYLLDPKINFDTNKFYIDAKLKQKEENNRVLK